MRTLRDAPRSVAGVAAAVAIVASALLAPGSAFGAVTTYVSGGTVVVKQAGEQPAADEGVVLCSRLASSQLVGVGGGCLPFEQHPMLRPAILVQDGFAGLNVAFQVCVDNDGDGICSLGHEPGQLPGECSDVIGFSHDDQGNFYNPLGFYRDAGGNLVPLPSSRPTNCPQTGFHGYIVFLCEGVHTVDRSGHTHAATTGTISTVQFGPIGAGDFCQTIRDPIIKSYFQV